MCILNPKIAFKAAFTFSKDLLCYYLEKKFHIIVKSKELRWKMKLTNMIKYINNKRPLPIQICKSDKSFPYF
jgi:hypothetical protein